MMMAVRKYYNQVYNILYIFWQGGMGIEVHEKKRCFPLPVLKCRSTSGG